MQQSVAAHLTCHVTEPAQLVLSIAAARGVVRESMSVAVDGRPLDLQEIDDHHGTRLHVVSHAPVGTLSVEYNATIAAKNECGSGALNVPTIDWVRYLRPSRYCESDRLAPLARAEFRGLGGAELVQGVADWVYANIGYVPGSSRSIDGAVATLLGREGVCRDFAHLVIALLRACEVPARLVSVYAPGLSPMDFHAIAEAAIDGQWYAVDATRLAPRSTLVRIATGRDAADTAFLTTTGGAVDLADMEVVAYTDRDLPADSHASLVCLGSG